MKSPPISCCRKLFVWLLRVPTDRLRFRRLRPSGLAHRRKCNAPAWKPARLPNWIRLLGFEHLLALPELRLHPHRRRDEEAAGKVDSQQPRRLRTRRAVILAERLRQPVDNRVDLLVIDRLGLRRELDVVEYDLVPFAAARALMAAIDQDPASTMFVLPTLDDARKFSRLRIAFKVWRS